jgi:hypothetical protein
MKPTPLLLAGSLVANVALVVVLLNRPAGPGAGSPADETSAAVSAAGPASAGATAATAEKQAAAALAASRQTWDHLRSDDLAALVARLRAAGFPPDVIRRVITALVTERFDARRLELEKDLFASPFWANNQNTFNDPKIGPALLKLQLEQTLLLKQLLGGNLNDLFADSEDNKALLRLQIGNIPPEKLDQLYATSMDYSQKRQAIYSALSTSAGVLLNTDREKLAAIDQGLRDDLGKFLSPAEVDDFLVHNSSTAYQLRQLLGPLQLSEAEYRAAYPLYEGFTEQFPQPANTLSPDQAAVRKAAEDLMNSQIKGLLSPDHAADYDQAANPAYGQLNRLVSRLDLPLSAAAQVVAVQTDTQARATELRSDTSLSGDDRRAQLTALAQDATAKISTALGGDRGLEAYKTYGGQWLQNILPRPPKPKG